MINMLFVKYTPIPVELYYLIFWIMFILILYLVLMLIFKRKNYDFFSKIRFLTYIGIFGLIMIITFIFVYQVIEIYIITERTYSIGMLYMLITTIIMGMLILIIGIGLGNGNYMNYIIIFCIVIFSISGLGYIGFRIDFNVVDYLMYLGFFEKTYESNGVAGVNFFVYNILFFILVIFISTIFEKGGNDDN